MEGISISTGLRERNYKRIHTKSFPGPFLVTREECFDPHATRNGLRESQPHFKGTHAELCYSFVICVILVELFVLQKKIFS